MDITVGPQLFLTPHLCVVTALLAAKRFAPTFRSRETQLAVLVAILAVMSVKVNNQKIGTHFTPQYFAGYWQHPRTEANYGRV